MSNGMTRKEIEENLITKAWKDSSFKQNLIADPRSVLEAEGIDLPKNIEVRVVEESADVFYLVIPSQPNGVEELSEEELEAIAGGLVTVNFWC